MQQLMVQFGDVHPFLVKYSDISPTTNSKLKGFFNDQMRRVHLYIELASVIDWGEHFIKATYNLEGDGPLRLTCYEEIDKIFAAIHSGHCPNVEAISKKLAREVRGVRENQMKQYAQNAIQPGLDYFKSQMEGSLKGALDAFKSARLFSPHKAHTMKPVTSDVDSLKSFPFFDNALKEMKEELPTYLAKCADTDEVSALLPGGSETANSCQFGLQPLEKCCLFSQVLLLLSVFFLCSVLPSMTNKITHCKTTLRLP